MKSAILGAAVVLGLAATAHADEVTISVTGDSVTVTDQSGAVVAEGGATIVIDGDGEIVVSSEDGAASESTDKAATDGTDAAQGASGAIPASADVAAGEEAYQAVCRNCHGPKAQGIASYPRLSDKDYAYIVDRLETYREGERVGPNSMLMIPHARPLADEDIVNLAAYITTAFD